LGNFYILHDVSTHSRPKAAANTFSVQTHNDVSFNTQPPEGGCFPSIDKEILFICFNTQPPEGGCSLHKKVRKIS